MNSSSTQQFIDIAGIKDGIIIMKNGGYRLIFSVSAVNFSLKSEEEQNSLIFQYQSFLNSLHFPVEIVMRSKKLDLNPYIKKLETIKNTQTNELIRLQTEDYMDFVTELINLANIMKKTFYVVVSYDPTTIKAPSIVDKLLKKEGGPTNIKISDIEFNRYKDELMERANSVANGLAGMGLHCTSLNTEQVIELFYMIYNPEIADKERLENSMELTEEFITKTQNINNENTEASEAEEAPAIDNFSVIQENQKRETQERLREEENNEPLDDVKAMQEMPQANPNPQQNQVAPATNQSNTSQQNNEPIPPNNGAIPPNNVQVNTITQQPPLNNNAGQNSQTTVQPPNNNDVI